MERIAPRGSVGSIKAGLWPFVIGLAIGILYGALCYYVDKKAGHPVRA